MRGHCDRHGRDEERWGASRHRHSRYSKHGFFGRHGHGRDMDPDNMRAGRMLAQGDLRLIALALIEQEPRHGYEIIKLVEEKTGDWYSPSPGVVYPTLTYLEEAGYVTASAEGSKKLYTITGEGRAYLAANREVVDVVLARLAAVGERISQWQRDSRGERRDRGGLPPLTQAALDHLRETVGKRLQGDADAEAQLVEILARAAAAVQRK
jgi:DNA-binding PadR family transcriptional regulator